MKYILYIITCINPATHNLSYLFLSSYSSGEHCNQRINSELVIPGFHLTTSPREPSYHWSPEEQQGSLSHSHPPSPL